MKQKEITLVYLEMVPAQLELARDLRNTCKFMKSVSLVVTGISENRQLKFFKKKHKFKLLPCLIHKINKKIERVYGYDNIYDTIKEYKDAESESRRREREARERAGQRISRRQQYNKLNPRVSNFERARAERESGNTNLDSSDKGVKGNSRAEENGPPRQDPVQKNKRDLVRYVRSRASRSVDSTGDDS